MKAILIVAATLMTGASVYGVVDYSRKANTREFKELYSPAKTPVDIATPVTEARPVTIAVEEPPKNEVKGNTVIVKKKKSPAKKVVKQKKEKRLKFSEFSRGKPRG